MSVLKYVIEFINEAICDKDFAEDNWIGKGGRGSPRENRHLELQNVLNKKWLNIHVIQGSALHAWVSGK